jgi:hypothetical protein
MPDLPDFRVTRISNSDFTATVNELFRACACLLLSCFVTFVVFYLQNSKKNYLKNKDQFDVKDF